ncbi:thioesterase II family protein [Actinokineospora iranica]|uniref:Pyochelin biosynthetic protein PchC n=1 Tax=Actinokineospora iranica TaxID=1271860 RepID=A0A1G6QXD1_9PSEU|nr:alpha/beta fold hydrolase [Actinokineospora iranica]SDC96988.1 pyochelin biosynthetic protein PchC [Actinokineospora iranica]
MWLRRWTPRPGATLRLLCLPHAGGSAAAFRSWADLLPLTVELVAVEPPGRGDRFGEPFAAGVDDVLDGVLTGLAALPRKPLAVFGHSLGALLALRVCRELRRRSSMSGQGPAALLVSSCPAPAAAAERMAGQRGCDDDGLLAQVRGLGGPAVDAGPDVLAAVRADLALFADGVGEAPPLNSPLRVYAGDGDDSVSPATLAAWRRESPGDFRLTMLPGGHFFFSDREPLFLARLAADIGQLSTVETTNGIPR